MCVFGFYHLEGESGLGPGLALLSFILFRNSDLGFSTARAIGLGYNTVMTADIILVDEPITRVQLKEIAQKRMGDLVKVVVDVEQGIMAIGGELHADEEAFLLERDSKQDNLWGINLYPDLSGPEMVEFDSVINMRPRQNNRNRSVESEELRVKILEIVHKLIQDD